MKKLISVLLALLMVFCLVGCGEKEAADAGEAKEEVAEKLSIAYVMNGTLGDKSFYDSGHEGFAWATEKYGDKITVTEVEESYDTAVWEEGLYDTVEDGHDIIVVGTYDMHNYTGKAATANPDTKFWFFDDEWNFNEDDPNNDWDLGYPVDNVYDMLFAQCEGSYLVGTMAAMASKTGKIAFLGGMDNKVLEDFFVGYASGAKAQNPDIHVNCSWVNSFSDQATAKSMATALYNQGYDVIFMCGGSSGLGAFEAAADAPEGNYIIGVDGNQGAYFASLGDERSTLKAERCLTSMQKNVNNAFLNAVELELEGKVPYGTNVTLGLDGGYVSASVTETTEKVLGADNLAKIDEITKGIIDGSVEVKTCFFDDYSADWFNAYVEEVK